MKVWDGDHPHLTRNRTPATQVFKAIEFRGEQSGARTEAAGCWQGINLERSILADASPDVPRAGITPRTGRRGRLAEFGGRRGERRRVGKQTRGARERREMRKGQCSA